MKLSCQRSGRPIEVLVAVDVDVGVDVAFDADVAVDVAV
jgi:hypothetical protein